MKRIPMPPRHSMADKVVRAASKSLYLAASKNFGQAKISDVGEIVSGGTPSTTKPELWDGDIVWITPKDLGRPRNIEIDDSERKISPKGTNRLLPKGTVLFSSRAPIGHAGIAAIELCTNQGFKNIICSDKLYNRYLFHILRANIEELDSLGHGNTFKEIPAKVLAEFEIPIPPIQLQKEIGDLLDMLYLRQAGEKIELPELSSPLTDQRRIVAHIESLAARVNEALRLREDASEGTEALLHSSMRQVFKPDRSKIVPLETTCTAIIDNLHSNPNYSGDRVVPCIRSSDVGWGELFLETARKTSEEEYTGRTVRGEPTENDIVLVREGGGTGKAALVEKHHRFSLGQRVMMLRPDQSVVLPKFLLYQILSPFIYDEQILPLSKGSASPHLNIGSLRKFKFILPPLDEQRRIVAYLDGLQAKVNALRELQSASGEELSALMPSILDKAFKVEL